MPTHTYLHLLTLTYTYLYLLTLTYTYLYLLILLTNTYLYSLLQQDHVAATRISGGHLQSVAGGLVLRPFKARSPYYHKM